MIERIKQKAREAREEFISKRTILEKEISEFSDSISKVDPELVAHIQFPKVQLTARALFPSLYEDKVNVEKYEDEKRVVIPFLKSIDDVRNRLIQEAEEELNSQVQVKQSAK